MWNPTTVSLSDRVEDAYTTLVDNDYLSAPVVDDFGTYHGFVDMMDLTSFAIDAVDSMTPREKRTENFFRTSSRFRNAKVRDLKHRPRRIETHPDFSLHHAFENLARHDQHRIAVLDRSRNVVGVLTQSKVMEWINDHLVMLAWARDTPIWKIRPYSLLVSVRESEPAIDAFRLMEEKNISGVAVVNDRGELTDCISIKDLRGIGPSERFYKLFDSVDDFKDSIKDDYADAPWSAQYVLRTATLEQVIRKLVSEKIHRVFVVDNEADRRPIDVISQTDVLKYLLDQFQGQGS